MGTTDIHFDAVVVGLGQTGLSCLRHLSGQGLKVAATDSRIEPPGLPAFKDAFEAVPICLGEIKRELLLSAKKIILSPGVSLHDESIKLAIEKGIPVCGDIELFCQQTQKPIIAITGSNGKSTVTTLVAEMARRAGLKTGVGGNLGTPVLELLDDSATDIYVLELSSFQLETTFSLNAHASVVLNLSSDHMNRYISMKHYADAKRRVYAGDGLMVINKDDPMVREMADETRKQVYFSLSEPADFGLITFRNDTWLCRGKEKIIRQSEVGIQGRHNVANALAAIALASSIEVPTAAVVDTLRMFNGLAHRCQRVVTIGGVDWYNDSKATNVGACIASIEGLHGQGDIVLIAGGDSKEADLSDLAPVVKRYVKHALLLGADATRLRTVFEGMTPVTLVEDMREAVDMARRVAQAGDLVLLAPACASQDMYNDYRQRGDAFVEAVNALEKV